MSNSNVLCAVEYEAETNWAENVAFTPTHRLSLLDPVDLKDLSQDAIEATRHVQQLQGGTTPVLGPKDATFTERMYLHGHGGATSGAVTIDPVETYWGYIFGNPSLGEANSGPTRSAANGTTAAAGSTTTAINTAASGTIARGSGVRIGTSGLSADTRGAGQFYFVNNHTGTVLTLRHATLLAPNAADVIHSGVNLYLPELTANSAVKGLRKRFLTANQKYETRGCYPKALRLTGLGPAEIPLIESDWGASWWQSTNVGAFPSLTASNQYNPAPNGGGSFVYGSVGSTVRTLLEIRAFSISIELGIVPLPGHNGVDPYQRYVGARRVPSKITGQFTFDAEASGTNTFESLYLARTAIWMTNSLSTAAGSAMGLHLQNCVITKRPKQTTVNGINSIIVDFQAFAGSDTTTELSQSAMVLCAA